MSLLPRLLLSCVALLGAACSCSEGDPGSRASSYPAGAPIDLLARKPDLVAELPGPVVPRGDSPGTVTWGDAEGPGWSQTDLRLPDGTPYRVTNQARAELVLSASLPEERELALYLWCARAVRERPARVSLTLNGVDLAPGGLEVGGEPAPLRVAAPAAAWRAGTNHLELSTPVVDVDGARAWDTLALARLEYGREARYAVDLGARTALLADGTGARYALELADAAQVEIEGLASAPGVLTARAGTMDPRTGTVEMESGDPSAFVANAAGPLRGMASLPRRAGAVRLLELEWRADDGGTLALSKLVARERNASRPRPPIVLVSIDTFAARHLALYGYERATSPELARFQRDAVLFERCLTNAPWTLPSYLSLFSGLYPRAHSLGLEFQAGADIQPDDLWQLAENRWTLAEALRARGYVTGGFVDTLWLSPRYRVNQGFDNYNGDAAMADFENPDAHIEHIVGALVPGWLRTTDAEHPPFLFVHALDAHGPYLPDAPFRDAFVGGLEEGGTMVPAGSDNQTYRAMPWWMSCTLQPDLDKPQETIVPLEEVVARYDESLLKVDAYLGKLFEHLRSVGLYDDAVIVVTGDHGEHFGPGSYGHGMMYESVLHVPLLVKLPKNEHGGTRVKAPVALVDVYPTLLELAGVPADGARLHGSSLLASLRTADAGAERPLYSEGGHVEQYALTQGCWRLVEERPGSESSEAALLTHPRVPDAWLAEHFPELLTRPLSKALLGELSKRAGYAERVRELRKLVAGPYYSLFDLCGEDGDGRDLAEAEPERLARMKAALDVEKRRSLAARKEARVSGWIEPLSPAQRAALEALGYGGEGAEEDDEPEPPKPSASEGGGSK